MEIDRQTVVSLLRERGAHDQAQRAEQELPEKLDHQDHHDLLEELGLNPHELLGRIGL